MLLELAGRLGAGELTVRLRYWLSIATDAADNARLVSGLFALHRATLVRNRALNDGGTASFDRDLARKVANLDIPTFAATPNKLVDAVERALRGDPTGDPDAV